MKRLVFVLSMVFIAACMTGCVMMNFSPGQGGSLAGKGDPEVYTFQVGEFSEIKLDIFCETHYYAAESDVVTVEIQPNLYEYISVEESGGVLIVRSTRNINWSSKAPVLTISTPVLNGLTLEGASDFTAHDPIRGDSFTIKMEGAGSIRAELDVDNLTVVLSGVGDLELSGRADRANFAMDGVGSIEALFLKTRETTINQSGAGDIAISCSEKLNINANGIGSVEYRGSPTLNLNNSGLVSVKKVD